MAYNNIFYCITPKSRRGKKLTRRNFYDGQNIKHFSIWAAKSVIEIYHFSAVN
jgi:hypothetical protein